MHSDFKLKMDKSPHFLLTLLEINRISNVNSCIKIH